MAVAPPMEGPRPKSCEALAKQDRGPGRPASSSPATASDRRGWACTAVAAISVPDHATLLAHRGAALYDKFANFVEDLQKIGERLDQARSAYDDASNKLVDGRGNLLRQVDMLRELGVKARKQLPRELADRALAESGEGEVARARPP